MFEFVAVKTIKKGDEVVFESYIPNRWTGEEWKNVWDEKDHMLET